MLRQRETQHRYLTACACICVLIAATRANAGDGIATLRTNLAWQIALERVGFSPGVIDGSVGRKTETATREFQRVKSLPQTGRLDPATRAALGVDPASAVTTYAVTSADIALVGPAPTDWLAKSLLDRLGYESLDAALSERFHCTRGLLARLNPGRKMTQLRAGDTLNVPAIDAALPAPRGDRIEINLVDKIIRVLDRDNRLVGLFHCSIAKSKDKLPAGETKVVVVTEKPSYTFDPKMWPEVRGIDRKLLIPPGPRNPVGLCWIGLGRPGVGIHGSPAPEMIGKTGSHGCFRLTNWDAIRLARMIRVGTRVLFVG